MVYIFLGKNQLQLLVSIHGLVDISPGMEKFPFEDDSLLYRGGIRGYRSDDMVGRKLLILDDFVNYPVPFSYRQYTPCALS
jgi:hypothetical protein